MYAAPAAFHPSPTTPFGRADRRRQWQPQPSESCADLLSSRDCNAVKLMLTICVRSKMFLSSDAGLQLFHWGDAIYGELDRFVFQSKFQEGSWSRTLWPCSAASQYGSRLGVHRLNDSGKKTKRHVWCCLGVGTTYWELTE
ncbi:hypothetical protein AKJ16_DCAP04335 [Drosera capensis]